MTYDPDVAAMEDEFNATLAEKNRYIVWLEDALVNTSKIVDSYIKEIESGGFGEFITKDEVSGILKEIREEL